MTNCELNLFFNQCFVLNRLQWLAQSATILAWGASLQAAWGFREASYRFLPLKQSIMNMKWSFEWIFKSVLFFEWTCSLTVWFARWICYTSPKLCVLLLSTSYCSKWIFKGTKNNIIFTTSFVLLGLFLFYYSAFFDLNSPSGSSCELGYKFHCALVCSCVTGYMWRCCN